MPRSVSASFPAPVGGWNARDPLAAMDPADAVKLVNFIPNTTSVTLRQGYRVHTPSGMGTGVVETLAEYVSPSGTRQLIAAANSNLYNCSTYNAAATSLATATTSNQFQTCMFKDAGGTSYLVMFNGADTPKKYDGTTVTNAVYTGVGTPANLIHPTVFKSTLYIVEKNTTIVWYGATNAVQGALTSFDVGSLLKLGGKVLFCGAWSLNTTSVAADLFVIVSNMGECLVYNGYSPTAANWALVGRYYLPVPIGIRAGFNLGSDFLIITQSGVLSMSDVVQNVAPATYNKLTDKIRNSFSSVTELYSSNFGWSACVYPRRNIALINIPITASSRSDQYVMNILTGAWTRFIGWNALCFSLYNENLYFGGSDGKVYQADYGQTDNGSTIAAEIRTAFNYFGDDTRQKQFLMVRPTIATTTTAPVLLDIDTDFNQKTITSTASVAGSASDAWDAATWDSSYWGGGAVSAKDWYSVSGIGYCGSVALKASFSNVNFDLSSLNVIYKPAGYL